MNFMNVAATFKSFFTNANTAERTYTFQDRTGTIADTADCYEPLFLFEPGFDATYTQTAMLSDPIFTDPNMGVMAMKIKKQKTVTTVKFWVTDKKSGTTQYQFAILDSAGNRVAITSWTAAVNGTGLFTATFTSSYTLLPNTVYHICWALYYTGNSPFCLTYTLDGYLASFVAASLGLTNYAGKTSTQAPFVSGIPSSVTLPSVQAVTQLPVLALV
jgi:hypothetical protein